MIIQSAKIHDGRLKQYCDIYIRHDSTSLYPLSTLTSDIYVVMFDIKGTDMIEKKCQQRDITVN